MNLRQKIIEEARNNEVDISDMTAVTYHVFEDREQQLNGRIPARRGLVFNKRMGWKNASAAAKEISWLENSFTYVVNYKNGKIIAVYQDGEEVA
jgi:hypothetical protein|tara:strand:- start:244 stop:525 length:282 start_codon:yes stop_codon:yes gene_type:complete